MHELALYQNPELLYQSAHIKVVRAYSVERARSVIIKTVADNSNAAIHYNAMLRHEYGLLCRLNSEYVVRALALQQTGNRYQLVLEDDGGEDLKALQARSSLSIRQICDIAVKISRALLAIHRENIVHRDISPANIIVNLRSGAVKLADFGLATALDAAQDQIEQGRLVGTLLYMAPEQTGRIARPVDQRSDFYAFGAVLYEMLAKTPPFKSDDDAACLHAHIAQRPKPLLSIDPGLPKPLAELVEILLAKEADARYQSSFGLLHDLQLISHSLDRGSESIVLRSRDVPERLVIPKRLYGREHEFNRLLQSYNQCRESQSSELLLVNGHAGVGKSALIAELKGYCARDKALFMAGKFEQYTRSSPFSAVVGVLETLALELLTWNENELLTLRQGLAKSLGRSLRVLVDLAPSMQHVLGSQPALEQLSAGEASVRTQEALLGLFRTLSRLGSSAVLVLDDVQWIDLASLALLERMLEGRIPSLLVIVSYRDVEVDAQHPLALLLKRLYHDLTVNSLALKSLSLEAVNSLIADAFSLDQTRVLPLSRLALEKTGGNPFYLHSYLRDLHDEKLLYFDREHGQWQWQQHEIAQRAVAENVVDFLVRSLNKLRSEGRVVLQLISCLGNSCNFALMAEVSPGHPSMLAKGLVECVQAGLIVLPLSRLAAVEAWSAGQKGELDLNFTIRFAHDRIAEAAYGTMEDSVRLATHLAAARALEQQAKAPPATSIATHYIEAEGMIQDPAERRHVLATSIKAAEEARRSGASSSALAFAQFAERLLAGADEQSESLAFTIGMLLSELYFLNQQPEKAAQTAEHLLASQSDPYRKALVVHLLSYQQMAKGDFLKSLSLGIAALELLQIKMPTRLTAVRFKLAAELVRALPWTMRTKGQDILTREPIKDAKLRFCLRLLMEVSTCAFQVGKLDLALLCLMRSVALAHRHGNCPEAAPAYMTFTVVLNTIGMSAKAKEYCQMALKMAEDYAEPYWYSRTLVSYCLMCHFWHFDYRELPQWMERAMAVAREAGDTFALGVLSLNYGAYNLATTTLDQVTYLTQSFDTIIKTNTEAYLADAKLRLGYTKNLRGETLGPSSLSYDDFDESKAEEALLRLNALSTLAAMFAMKAIIEFYNADYTKALAAIKQAEVRQQAVLGLTGEFFVAVYGFLIRAGLCYGKSRWWHLPTKLAMYVALLRVRRWQRHNPANFSYARLVLEAEWDRVRGKAKERVILAFQKVLKPSPGMTFQSRSEALVVFWRYLTRAGFAELGVLVRRELKQALGDFAAHRILGALGDAPEQAAYGRPHPAEHPRPGSLALLGSSPSSRSSSSQAGSSNEVVDFLAIIKSAEALYSEPNQDKLLDKLLAVVMENAGASSGAVISVNEDMKWQVLKVRTDVEGATLGSMPKALLTQMVQYALRTGSSLHVEDVARDWRFQGRESLADERDRAAALVQMKYRGELLGFIYLGQSEFTGAFAPQRMMLVELLATQAAVAIKNASLYTALEQKVMDRTRDIQAIFANIKQGILTITPQTLIVGEEYSRHLVEILVCGPLAGKRFLEDIFREGSLEGKKRELMAEVLSLDGDELVKELPRLPQHVVYHSEAAGTKTLELDWVPIYYASMRLKKVMLSIRDVTELALLKAREHEASRSVQTALLSKQQQPPDVTIATYYNAAEFVGGDWYGYYHDPVRHRLFLFMGDVTGHGTASALVTGAVSGALGMEFLDSKDLAEDTESLLKRLMLDLHRIVLRTGEQTGRMMTMAAVAVEQGTGEAYYLNAGHPYILQLSGGEVIQRVVIGSPLGYWGETKFDCLKFTLAEGDGLALFTDGLFEYHHDREKALNPKRLKKLLAGKTPEQAVQAIEQRLEAQWVGEPLRDDCACLIVRFDAFLSSKARDAA